MDYTEFIVDLYSQVYELHKRKYGVRGESIRVAIQNMKEAYLPNPNWQLNYDNATADYNDPAPQCAYLHKYAMVHTGLLCDILQSVLRQPHIYRELASKSQVKLCSLGGGPGTDIVSLLIILEEIFGFMRINVSVIDYFQNWEIIFESILNELKSNGSDVSDIVSSWYFSYQYLSANLLSMSTYNAFKVLQAVKTADIITMVKFISAAACDKTKSMVKQIFQNMKVGAMLIFVDNAAGGFDKMMREVALECGLESAYGLVKHYDYCNESFRLKRYGYDSQYKTKVSFEVWKKTREIAYNTTQQLRREYIHGPSRRSYGNSSQNTVHISRETTDNEGCCSII